MTTRRAITSLLHRASTSAAYRPPVRSFRTFSSAAAAYEPSNTETGPVGELFQQSSFSPDTILGQSASISRTFGPTDNDAALLVAGGDALAAHASFDPNFVRASSWIRHHAVGHAALSPVLLQGLVGALVEAAFPQGVVLRQSTNMHAALIVGVAVEAKATVTQVVERDDGYELVLDTVVQRMRDQAVVATGEQAVWIPEYCKNVE